MFPADPKRFEHLSKREIYREIDSLHEKMMQRSLTHEENDDLFTLQNQLKVHMELERIDGVRR